MGLKIMSFLLRAAFWLTVLAFLLPAAGYQATPHGAGTAGAKSAAYVTGEGPDGAAEPDVDAGEMLSLAARSAQDMMGFCGRNPEVCERSHAVVAHVARQTAFYGSKLFLWLTEKAREEQESRTASPEAAVAPQPRSVHQPRLAGA